MHLLVHSRILRTSNFHVDPANGLSFSTTNPKDFPAQKIKIRGRKRGWKKRDKGWNKREKKEEKEGKKDTRGYAARYTAISIGAGKRTIYNGWNIVPSKPLSDISSTFLFLLFRVFPRAHVASPPLPAPVSLPSALSSFL